MMRRLFLFEVFLLIAADCAFAAVQARSEVELGSLFQDKMVLQQQTRTPIWGWATPGENVSIRASWGEQTEAIADQSGKWMGHLKTTKAGGPYTITISTSQKSKTLKHVLLGEVWLCSGQSNMEKKVKTDDHAEEAIAEANFPNIRIFTVTRNAAHQPVQRCGGKWVTCSPDTVADFSAVAYFSARKMHQKLDVPIGIIVAAWAGTSIEAWIPKEPQMSHKPTVSKVLALEAAASTYDEKAEKKHYAQKLKEWKEAGEPRKSKPKLTQNPIPGRFPTYPGLLYNAMIQPLAPYSVKGVMWYQGESNAGTSEIAYHYRNQLVMLTQYWRALFCKTPENMPFFFVQLPNYELKGRAEDNLWPILRESFLSAVKQVEASNLIVTIDIGNPKDIHPRNKQDYGNRLAQLILHDIYSVGKHVEYPLYQKYSVQGSEIFVYFEKTGSGLVAKNGPLKTFEIAGADQIWHPAEAIPKGNAVIVSSKDEPKPVAVRYAWANNPEGCNLYTREGLPASPFRTNDGE